MTLFTIERISPFSKNFSWDNYTNELYRFSDDYGYLTIDQMKKELNRFKMQEYIDKITYTMSVDEFVDFLFDANT